MQVEVKVIKSDNDSPDRAKTLHVETHARRGENFNVEKIDNIDEGSTVTFNVPNGGRLVLNTPIVHNEPVLDREQMASIHTTQQENREARADQAKTEAGRATGSRVAPAGETPEQRKVREDQARQQTLQGNSAPAAGARTVGGSTATSNPSAGVPAKKPGDETTEKPQP